MIEFIRRKNLLKTLSDDRRTLANALVKVSESKFDMSGVLFFKRGPSYRGNKKPMLVPKHTCGRDTRVRKPSNCVSQLLPMIFRISRNMKIQDAVLLTLLRRQAIFSSKVITIHITKVIPCLSRHQSPSALGSLGKRHRLEKKNLSLVQLWYHCMPRQYSIAALLQHKDTVNKALGREFDIQAPIN